MAALLLCLFSSDCCCWLFCSRFGFGFGFRGVEKERQRGRVKGDTREERERGVVLYLFY